MIHETERLTALQFVPAETLNHRWEKIREFQTKQGEEEEEETAASSQASRSGFYSLLSSL